MADFVWILVRLLLVMMHLPLSMMTGLPELPDKFGNDDFDFPGGEDDVASS